MLQGWATDKEGPYDPQHYYRHWMHELRRRCDWRGGRCSDVHHADPPVTARLSPIHQIACGVTADFAGERDFAFSRRRHGPAQRHPPPLPPRTSAAGCATWSISTVLRGFEEPGFGRSHRARRRDGPDAAALLRATLPRPSSIPRYPRRPFATRDWTAATDTARHDEPYILGTLQPDRGSRGRLGVLAAPDHVVRAHWRGCACRRCCSPGT
jgi:hypothetical protein